MSKKRVISACLVLLLGLVPASVVTAAEVTAHIYVDFVGTLSGTAYTLGARELDTTGTFAAHDGTEIVSDGLGVLADAAQSSQESFEFDASSFNGNGTQFTGTAFIVEAVFTNTEAADAMAPIMDIGGQCFIRFHDGLSAGCWNGSTEEADNNIQEIPNLGETHHYAIVYDGADTIDYYLDGEAIFQSTNGSPQQITTLISWGNIRHSSVDGGRQLRGEYDEVAFSTFTGTFDPATDFVLPGGPTSRDLAVELAPVDEATDVFREVILEWLAGESAVAHDVYFGTVFDDVNTASRDNPMDVLVSEGQSDTTYAPGRLEFGVTYYWRIDEVGADGTIYQGAVWSFTAEPQLRVVEGVVATSNGVSDDGLGPDAIVDGSGLNAEGLHSMESADAWAGSAPDGESLWMLFELDQVYKLQEVRVWNYNVQYEFLLGIGIANATIEYSPDGTAWTALGDVDLEQGLSQADYACNNFIDFAGVPVKYVRLTANSNFGTSQKYGLSEVQFMCVPVQAREPEPADGATEVDIDTELSWRAGREAVSHEVYLDSDAEAVADGSALVATVEQNAYVPADLQFGNTYYWKITEVNDAEAIAAWEGAIWSFTTREYGVIDDFEAYDDENNTIFDTWIDGWINGTGSTVGYFEAPFAERAIVHGGRQSMPLAYNNADSPFYSEAFCTWAGGLDLTAGGANSLQLHFHGAEDNEGVALYVAVEDSSSNVAVVSHDDPDAVLATEWRAWQIPFSALSGVNMASVETIYVGLGDRDNPSAGGTGIIYVDDIGFGSPLTDSQ